MTRLLPVLFVVGAASACGPIRSTTFLIDADVALQAAHTARADQYAPFEFTSAQLYLLKAREEVGYSDYEVALDFAKKASRFANEARDKALTAAGIEISSPPPSND